MLVSRSRFLSIVPDLKGKVNNVIVKTSDKKDLNCWEINPNNSKKYVLFLHGMSQNISHNQPLYSALNNSGYAVLALEYRGFGKNKLTKVTEPNICRDAQAGLDYLKKKVPAENITLIGHSAGSAVAVDLAKNNGDIARVVLVSPINGFGRASTYVLSSTKKKYMPNPVKNFIVKYPAVMTAFNKVFKTDLKIAEIKSPTYLIHSGNDTMIPVSTAVDLSQKAKNMQGLVLLPKGGHKLEPSKIESIVNILNPNPEK
jgi:alpha-beta hydrolase superfamily lysophospholipase